MSEHSQRGPRLRDVGEAMWRLDDGDGERGLPDVVMVARFGRPAWLGRSGTVIPGGARDLRRAAPGVVDRLSDQEIERQPKRV